MKLVQTKFTRGNGNLSFTKDTVNNDSHSSHNVIYTAILQMFVDESKISVRWNISSNFDFWLTKNANRQL